jgi:hypothetical protein
MLVMSVNETPLFCYCKPNCVPLPGTRTMSGWQFNWGGFLLKSNAGAQRFPYPGWKSGCKRKGIWELYCKTYKSSSYESRA